MLEQKNKRAVQRGPLIEPAPAWFVNRERELNKFWEWGRGVPYNHRHSYALIGLRRIGKTTILHKTFNRLFHEQDRVVPIYISFAEYVGQTEPLTAEQFARKYFTSIIRCYLAFRYRELALFEDDYDLVSLKQVALTHQDELALKWFERYARSLDDPLVPYEVLMQWLVNLPRHQARARDLPMAIIIDEFQVLTRVYNPDDGFVRDMTNSFQHASESHHAPLLVSGSSLSMMDQALSGAVSGRFQTWTMGPLSQLHTIDMVFRLAQDQALLMTEELALAIYELTAGYPYSIESLLLSKALVRTKLSEAPTLNDLAYFEVTQGDLRKHYHFEYGKYINQLNGDGITRKILFWLTNFPGEHLHPRRLAETLQLDRLKVHDALEKLCELDILVRETMETFWGPTDPLLLEYLRHTHYVSVEELTPQDVEAKLRRELNALRGETNRRVGYFAEIIVAGLMQHFDDRTVDGTIFSAPQTVRLRRLNQVQHREGVVKIGHVYEIDVVGEYDWYDFEAKQNVAGAWLVSVRYRQNKMNAQDVAAFLAQVAAYQAEKQFDEIKAWYFSKAGFTANALKRLTEANIYFSDLSQFNQLVDNFGLLPLDG